MRTTRSLLACVSILAALGLAGCGADSGTGNGTATQPVTGKQDERIRAMLPDRIRQSGKIVVSNPLRNPPYAFKLPDGALKGIAPDLSRALEPLLGVRFEWVDTTFPGLIPGLQAARFDMIWGSITDTEEREKVLDFVDYHIDGALLLVAKGNPDGLTSLEDACGKRIAALQGAVQIQILEGQSARCSAAGKQPVDVRVYPDVPQGELSVRSGQTTAFFAGVGAARYQATVAGGVFETAGPIYKAAPFGAGFRKDDTGLSTAIQEGLKALVNDGAYRKILDGYGMGATALTSEQILVNGAARLSRETLVLPR